MTLKVEHDEHDEVLKLVRLNQVISGTSLKFKDDQLVLKLSKAEENKWYVPTYSNERPLKVYCDVSTFIVLRNESKTDIPTPDKQVRPSEDDYAWRNGV